LTPKSIGVIYRPRQITILSLKFLGLSVLRLLIGNHLVYGKTGKCKAIYPHFFKGGHNYDKHLSFAVGTGNGSTITMAVIIMTVAIEFFSSKSGPSTIS
jgi:hypothetical protein